MCSELCEEFSFSDYLLYKAMSEQNSINGDIPGSEPESEIYKFSSADAQERAFKGKIKQLSGDCALLSLSVCRLK